VFHVDVTTRTLSDQTEQTRMSPPSDDPPHNEEQERSVAYDFE